MRTTSCSAAALDPQRLRTAFVVYGAMNRKDWRMVSADEIAFEPRELRNQLVPTLRTRVSGDATALIARARSLNDECRDALRVVLPLAEAESEFLDRLLDHGEIVPALLTNDPVLRGRIAAQPMLARKSLNVRRRKDSQENDLAERSLMKSRSTNRGNSRRNR